MLASPFLHATDILRPAEVVLVLGFLQPSFLTCNLGGFTACGFEAEFLPFGVARVRLEEDPAMPTFALPDRLCHRPGTSRVDNRANRKNPEEDAGRKWKEKKYL